MQDKDKTDTTSRTATSPTTPHGQKGPGASNVGTSPRDGGSRSAGLTRDRADLRNPGEDGVMDSAISGEDSRIPDVPDSQRQGKMHGDINDPEPDKPDPEGIPRARSDRADTD